MSELNGRLARPGGHELAWRRTPGRGPAIVWLGGFMSDMTGTKAQAIADWAETTGRDFLRFDYFGHGASSGAFADGTIGRWREDALEAIDELTDGPLVLVGSSMGGWIASLAALARPERLKAMVLIAPAADFTDKLIWAQLPPEARDAITTRGVWVQGTSYEPEGIPITRRLIEDGATWSILPGPVAIDAPVRVLHGGRDEDVPWAHGLALAQAIRAEDVVFSLIKDGDHRLSRPQDLIRLIAAVEEMGL